MGASLENLASYSSGGSIHNRNEQDEREFETEDSRQEEVDGLSLFWFRHLTTTRKIKRSTTTQAGFPSGTLDPKLRKSGWLDRQWFQPCQNAFRRCVTEFYKRLPMTPLAMGRFQTQGISNKHRDGWLPEVGQFGV